MKEKRVCYSLPIGPQHPALVEAENLMVKVDGETIVDVDINVGYLHRGIEELMQRRSWMQNVYLAERVCGICSSAHQTAYCQLAENLLEIEIPPRAKFIRTIIAELERLHSHSLWLGVLGYEFGLDTLFQLIWRDREYIMDILEKISGNRVNYAMCCIGGVRRDIKKPALSGILKSLKYFDKRMEYYRKVFLKDRTVLARTKRIGILKSEDVEKFSIVGPLARASGIDYDIRKLNPYNAYGLVDWSLIVTRGCDVQARAFVRIGEMAESVRIIRVCLMKMPAGKLRVDAPLTVPENEAVSRVEAPRGELIYYGRSGGGENPERVKIRTPTYANLLSLKPMLKGQQLADLPVIVASIDPCFSCTDRVTLIDANSGERKVVDEAYLKKLGERK